MEIKIGSKTILKVLHVLSWVIFIGLCIEAGSVIFGTILTQILNPSQTKYLWREVDLSQLRLVDSGYFIVISVLICIVLVMKSLMFYLIVKLFHDKKLNLAQPFNPEIGKFVFNMAYLTLGIGFFSAWGNKLTTWLQAKGVILSSSDQLRFGGADVWLFMCVVLFVIAQIMKRGIELQEEHELTI